VTDGKEIRIVFLDISKAFDRVWHKGLLNKLKAAGITGRLLAWLKNYLQDRQQRVGLNGQFSEWGKIKAGVPQGSVLGPLLFLIFINDLTYIASKCKIRLFADDTCLFIEVDNPTEAANNLNQELALIEQWAKKWLVTFSPPKTKEMVITKKTAKRNHPPLILNNQEIETVTSHKHLGITLQSDLSWGEHVNQITTKANRLLNYLTPLKMKLDRKTLETAYFSFIRPILEYGDVIWDINKENDHTLDPIEKTNLNAARLVSGATARCNRAKLYEETKFETMKDRRKNHRLTMLYKMVYQLVPPLLYYLLPEKVENRTRHNLRSKKDIDTPYARIDAHKFSFLPSTIKDWNNLPIKTKEAKSINAFKHAITKTKDKPPPLYYMGCRWTNAQHARLRIGCSALKFDLYDQLKVIPDPTCACKGGIENAIHYMYDCQIYASQRQKMMDNLYNISKFNIGTLLYGDKKLSAETNTDIFKCVHTFMEETKRFA
jgi:hypothetical protein